ncbi:MAG: hypothetical protein A2Z75_04415 [Chloroflexi bacterium RBG_13_50_10]|nr:MAG: hypothetical protein A2Z75_04415 [Chloroflexi bacterium RBG_13_50_10]
MGDVCKVCGCTDGNACVTAEGPCYWVMKGLCSACYITLPPGENCFKGDVGLIIAKECRACACIIKGEQWRDHDWYTCSKGRFDEPSLTSGRHHWYAWTGINRPNKAVAKAQKKCPFWEVHPRYKAQKEQ